MAIVARRTVPVSGSIGSLATQGTSEAALNQINLEMRQQPWYQQFFAERGLNPNRVKLNDRQRAELAALAQANGFGIGSRMTIDQAGNINQKGGFAGMPTAAKIAIAAAPIAGAMLIPGVREATIGNISGLFGAGGGVPGAAASPLGGYGATAIPGAVATAAPPAAGMVGGGAAASGFGLNQIVQAAMAPTIGGISNYFSNRAAGNAARDAANASMQSANYAADLQAQGAEEQLAFLREQEEQRRREHAETEAKNLRIYEEERDYGRSRREPFHRFAVGSLGYLARPLSNIAQRRV